MRRPTTRLNVVQVAQTVSTDPQLATGTYAVLGDPKNIFGFQSAFQETYTSMTNLLTVDAMRSLNAAVAIDGKVPASVAHAFLVSNHLLTS